MNQFFGIKAKRLFVVLLFVPLFVVPSVCSAVNACISGTPILNVIAPNPKAPGGNVSYFGTAIGSGFATYEIVASDAGVLKSGTFSSGQTVSGNYNTPSGAGLITFIIKDSSGNVIPYCYADADITFGQDMCEQYFKNETRSDIGGHSMLYYSAYWGDPTWHFYCSRYASSLSRNYQTNFLNAGRVNSGSARDDQMLIEFYRIPFGTEKETFSFTLPGLRGSWLDGGNAHFLSWATNALPCDASFAMAGALTAGNDIQFDANNANIDWYRPDNYKWKVDGADVLQGNDKNVVYGSFSAGNHSVSLTVDDGLGTSCSSNKFFWIMNPPPPPACNATFTAPTSAYYDQNIIFDPTSSSNSGESDIVYKWSIDGTLSTQTGFSLPIFNRSFDSSNGPDVDIKLEVEHSNGSKCPFAQRVNLSTVPPPPPPPCTVDFDVRSGVEFCLTGSCNYNDPITFVISASSGPITDYIWTIKTNGVEETFTGGINTGASVSKTFYPADGKTHTVRLLSHDSNGYTCYMDKTINIQPSMPGWNEIAPYLMQLLGPIGFLGVVFLSRAIFLWL